MNPDTVYSRTVASWQMAFVYAGRTLHFLTRAVLLTLASAGLGFAWLCCWLDRFRTGNSSSAWLIPGHMVALSARDAECHRTASRSDRFQLRPPERYASQPRTIDSLIRNKGVRA